MSAQNDESQGLILGVVFGVLVLVVGLVLSLVIGRVGHQGASAGPGPAAAVTAAAQVAGDDVASVRVEGEVVKFFFVSGKTDLAAGSPEALAVVVRGVAAGRKAQISGYHDSTGDAARNQELAKQRALAVRDALLALGVPEDKMELSKPANTTADGSNADARRVEVTLQ